MYTSADPGQHQPPPLPPPPSPTRRAKVTAGIGLSLVAGAFAYTYAVDPNVASNPYPKCPLKYLTGIDCPGCGGLRSVHALLNGDLAGALDHNVLVILLLPFMLYVTVQWLLAPVGVRLPAARLPSWFSWAAPVLLVAFTVVRNIPGNPLYGLNSSV